MADIRKTVEVAYQADVSGIVKEVKKLPSVTEKEAKAMTKALSKNLKDSENAAKKAAATTEKSFQKMGASANKANLQFRKLKRSASEMGRGFSEISLLLSDTDSEFGRMAGQAAAFSMTASALAPLVGQLAVGIKTLGLAAGGAVLGGLGLVVASIASFASESEDAEQATKKQKEEMERLNKKIIKYNQVVETGERRTKALREQMTTAAGAIESLKESVEIERLRIKAQLDPSFVKDLEGLEEKVAFKDIDRRVKAEFDKVKNVLDEQLANQTNIVEARTNRIEALLGRDLSRQVQDVVDFSDFDDLETNLNKALKRKLKDIRFDRGRQFTLLLAIDESEAVEEAEELLQEFLNLRDAQRELNNAQTELDEFRKQRSIDEKEINKQLKENFRNEKNIDKVLDRRAKRKVARITLEDELKEAKEQVLKIEKDLTRELMSKHDQEISNIDSQIKMLEDLHDRNVDIARNEKDFLEVSEAIMLLLEKRQRLIAKNEEAEQQKERIKNQEKIQKDIEYELKLIAELNESKQLGLIDLLDLQKKYEDSTLESEQKIHDEILKMIEERNQKSLEGAKFLTSSIQGFGKSIMEVMENTGLQNEKLTNQLFALQQGAAVANIAMTTAENITKAQGFPPPLNFIGTGAAIAVGAAQTAAVLSQSPPKKHMGGMIGPDEVGNVTMLRGEAVLDRSTVRNIGEEGVRRLQENRGKPEVIVIQPFKHFDRYLVGRDRRQKKLVSGGY